MFIRRILAAFCAVIITISVSAVTPKDVVTSFGKALSAWCQTGSFHYREEIERLCNGVYSCRVEDKIHADYQIKRGLRDYETFVLDSYLNMFETLMSGGIRFNMSNITVETQDHYPDGQVLTFITADVRVCGKINYSVKDLFLVRDNKISGIYSYSSQLGFQHLNGSLIEALQREKYSVPYWSDGTPKGGFLCNGYAIVYKDDDRCGMIDRKGNNIIPCIWNKIFYWGGDLAWAKSDDSRDVYAYDIRFGGKPIPFSCSYASDPEAHDFPDEFVEGFLVLVNGNGDYGFLKGNDMEYGIQFCYDYATQFQEGYSYVGKNNFTFIINRNFEVVVQSTSKYSILSNFYEGLARIRDRETGKQGFINTKGDMVIPCIYDRVGHFSEGLCAVYDYKNDNSYDWKKLDKSDKIVGYIDKTGKIVIPTSLDRSNIDFEHPHFRNGYVCINNGSEFTLMGRNGKPIHGFSWYQYLGEEFKDGLIEYSYYRDYKDFHRGYLNKDGAVVINTIDYDYTEAFENSYACVGMEINGEDKWGCINKDGVLVVPCIYDSKFSFADGIALVSKDGETCLIDVFGNSCVVNSR